MNQARPSSVPARQAHAPAVPAAESGLRLLVAGRRLAHLRWSPDPCSPASHALEPGEIRLAILAFDLRSVELCGPAARRRPLHGQTGLCWSELPVQGVAEVIESTLPSAPVGRCLSGPMVVGTYRVLRGRRFWPQGFDALSHTEQGMALQRYDWCDRPARLPSSVGVAALAHVESTLAQMCELPHAPATEEQWSLLQRASSPGALQPILPSACPSVSTPAQRDRRSSTAPPAALQNGPTASTRASCRF